MRSTDNKFSASAMSRFARSLCIISIVSAFSLLNAETASDFTLNDNPLVSEGYAQLEAGQPDDALIAFGKAL